MRMEKLLTRTLTWRHTGTNKP